MGHLLWSNNVKETKRSETNATEINTAVIKKPETGTLGSSTQSEPFKKPKALAVEV